MTVWVICLISRVKEVVKPSLNEAPFNCDSDRNVYTGKGKINQYKINLSCIWKQFYIVPAIPSSYFYVVKSLFYLKSIYLV